MPWSKSSFLIGENLFNPCIFRNPFLIGIFLIRGKRGVQDISLYTHAWRPSKATSDSLEIHISPSTYSLQLILFSLLSSAYCLQLTISSLLSSAYCLQLILFSLFSSAYYLQLTVPKMQPSGMGWSYRLYNKVVSHEWSWHPCYVHRLLFRHGLITKLPLSNSITKNHSPKFYKNQLQSPHSKLKIHKLIHNFCLYHYLTFKSPQIEYPFWSQFEIEMRKKLSLHMVYITTSA